MPAVKSLLFCLTSENYLKPVLVLLLF